MILDKNEAPREQTISITTYTLASYCKDQNNNLFGIIINMNLYVIHASQCVNLEQIDVQLMQ